MALRGGWLKIEQRGRLARQLEAAGFIASVFFFPFFYLITVWTRVVGGEKGYRRFARL